MTDPRPEYVYRFERRRLFHVLFVVSCVLFVWQLIVLYGESQGWGDDPGRWALLPAIGWGLLGLTVFAIFIAYSLAHLVIRERPGQIYRLEGSGSGRAPSFLQPRETVRTTEAKPVEELPVTTAEAEPPARR